MIGIWLSKSTWLDAVDLVVEMGNKLGEDGIVDGSDIFAGKVGRGWLEGR